jgi:hypothetical protein
LTIRLIPAFSSKEKEDVMPRTEKLSPTGWTNKFLKNPDV